MATTLSNFVLQPSTNSFLEGAAVAAGPAVAAVNRGAAEALSKGDQTNAGLKILDKVFIDLSMAGYAKNGCAYVVLVTTTAVTLDLTTLATNATAAAGDTSFATWNQLVLVNTGAVDLVISPGASNPARLLLAGTSPTLTVPAGSSVTLQSVAGLTVDGTHKTITITPTAGGSIGLCVGGA